MLGEKPRRTECQPTSSRNEVFQFRQRKFGDDDAGAVPWLLRCVTVMTVECLYPTLSRAATERCGFRQE